MTNWKKALSTALTAVMLASLLATAAATSVFAAVNMTPTTGPAAGGTLVTITGAAGYSVATTITVDTTTVSPTSVSADGTSLTFLTPAHVAGLVSVSTAGPATVGLPGFLYTSGTPTPPTMAPVTGPTTGNTFVTISNGSGYVAGTTTVLVDGAAASVVFVSTDGKTLTFVTPAHAAGTVSVATVTPATIGLPGFTYAPVAPTLTIAPTSGSAAGGTVVTIGNGSAFDTSCRITIGTDALVVPTSLSADGTSLTFITPGDPAGSVGVAVTTCAGADVAPNFTYTATAAVVTFSPNTGPLTGGTVVTIAGGTGFSFATRITVGTVAGIVPTSVAADGKSLTFVTPAKPAADPNAASVSTTAPANAAIGTFTYAVPAAPPTVTAIAPATGPTGGGQSVVITGTGFAAGASVTIGGAAATFVGFVNTTTLTATTPAGVEGATNVIVKNTDGQSGSLTGGYTYSGAGAICSSATALGITSSGPFNRTTKVAALGKYQTIRLTCGSANGGKKIVIQWASKNSSGVWTAFTNLTTRIADANGNVNLYWRSYNARWLSFRAVGSQTVQARWR